MLSEHDLQLLTGDHPAVISTNTADGPPTTVVTWFLLDDPDHILVSIDASGSRGNRLEDLRRDARFSITVMNKDDWTDAVTVVARAVDFFPDHDLTLVDRMAQKHGQARYGIRRPRTAVRARIEKRLDSGFRRD